eukprot:174469-Pelagomonas_calceolata.AAC.1
MSIFFASAGEARSTRVTSNRGAVSQNERKQTHVNPGVLSSLRDAVFAGIVVDELTWGQWMLMVSVPLVAPAHILPSKLGYGGATHGLSRRKIC